MRKIRAYVTRNDTRTERAGMTRGRSGEALQHFDTPLSRAPTEHTPTPGTGPPGTLALLGGPVPGWMTPHCLAL